MKCYVAKCRMHSHLWDFFLVEQLPCRFVLIQTTGENQKLQLQPKNSPIDSPHLSICQLLVCEYV